MGPQVLDDLIRVLELLGGQVAVIEYPVILFPVFVLAAQDVHCRVEERQHLVAALNALCVVLQFRAADVCPGKVDGVKELLNAASVFDLEGAPYLLDGKLQVPDGIPVVLEQLPCVVEQGVLLF